MSDALSSQQLLRKLEQVSDAAHDWSDVWPHIGEWFAARQRGVFATAGRGRWAPLAAETIIRKQRSGIASSTPLIATGAFAAAVTRDIPRASGLRFAVYGPPKGGYVADDYAPRHVRGTRNMPRRNPVPKLVNNEKRVIFSVLRKHMAHALNGH